MNGGSNPSEQALQDYLDSLLDFDAPAAEDRPAPIKLAAAGNIATLPAMPRAVRPPPSTGSPTDRPYAEPIRTLNLRVPLPPVAPAPEVVQPVAEVVAPVQVAPPMIEQRALIAPAPEVVVPDPAAAPAETLIDDDDLAQMAAPADWLANGRPQWAQQPFECLLFKSGGLTLAAPLVELGSIYPMDVDALASVFGQTSWFMGMLPVKEYNARAIDTALVVMPERYGESMREAYRYLITLFGSDWGLAVDEVVNSVVLDPDSVRWRGQRSKRPWLAGTVVEHMCALLDISQLAWMFHNQDRKRKPLRPA